MQVVLSKEGIIVWFKDKVRNDPVLLSETYPSTQQEVEHMLNKIDTWNICAGGPNIEKSPNLGDARLKKIVKDGNHWRHTDCEVFVEKGLVCRHCVNVSLRLQQAVDRLNKRAKAAFPNAVECAELKDKIANREKLTINVTPRSVQNLQLLRKKLKSRTIRLSRKEKIIYALEEKIRDVSNKDEKCVDSFLNKNNVPKAQVRFRSKILHQANMKNVY